MLPDLNEHILVGLSSSPSNARILRTAAKMAAASGCRFTALFVQTPSHMSPENRQRLRENTILAQSLGATLETVFGDDVCYQLGEYARLSGVTRIVIGSSNLRRRLPWGKPAMAVRLSAMAPNIDILIVQDSASNSPYHPRTLLKKPGFRVILRDLGISLGILIPTTLVGFLFQRMGFSEANIITVYLLAVLISTVFTETYFSIFFCALAGVLTFNFFFTVPTFSLKAYEAGYPVTFLIMFLAGLITGSLASRWKNHVRQSARAAYRTNLIFETNQLLQKAKSDADIWQVAAGQLRQLLDRDFALIPSGEVPTVNVNGFVPDGKAVKAVRQTHHQVGLSYPVRVNERLYGVVSLDRENDPPEAFENSVLLSILGECALALESSANAREMEAAKLQAENEKLRANLLRSISHDLRTPLTSISGNAGILLANNAALDEDTRRQMYGDIYDDSQWLINLVENLLAVTRIDEGRMKLQKSPQLVEDIVDEALRHISRKRSEHTIKVEYEDEFLLALCDARLIVQVLINLVDNAIKYTPVGSEITISARQQDNFAVISVADNGEGLKDKENVFRMFYTGSSAIADSRRSLGLGLSLCKSIVTAHGGEIRVSDNLPHGAVFTFTIPSGEVTVHE